MAVSVVNEPLFGFDSESILSYSSKVEALCKNGGCAILDCNKKGLFMFKERFVTNIRHVSVQDDGEPVSCLRHFIMSDVKAEMKKSVKYSVKAKILASNNEILSLMCGCPAGLDPAFCKHSFALLYALQDYSSKEMYVASTEKLQTWHQPRFLNDYAETTMNELLGWYGYEKVDSRDTQGLNLQHFSSADPGGSSSPPMSVRDVLTDENESRDAADFVRTIPNGGSRTPTNSRAGSTSPLSVEGSSLNADEIARQNQQMVSALSSVTKRPDSPNLPPGCIVCAWCQKVGMKLFTLKTSNGCKAFCSELCFTQCRRASFKKNKICDWCKHVRHTVNYVDFQDGEQQLQFCSDKCLNQYKMNIFCKETQAHLQMHTHLKEAACKMAAGGSVNLITPDLWLRECKNQSNGGLLSPKESSALDSEGAILSDGNVSPGLALPQVPEPRSSSSSTKEIVPIKSEENRPHKLREKHHKRSSKMKSRLFSHHKSGGSREGRSHSFKLKSRKLNGSVISNLHKHQEHPNSLSSMQRNTLSNGPTSRLTSPNIVPPPSAPPSSQVHHQTLPPPLPRFHPPRLEHLRPPFVPPNMMGHPFHLLAQQHMENFMRTQNRLCGPLRSNRPPFPLPPPPWALPPIPHGVPPPRPILPPYNIPLPQPSRPQIQRTESQQPKQSKASGSQKPRHHHHSATHHSPSNESTTDIPTTSAKIPPTPSLLPPVTVMVPFPVVLPLPFPIPIPIPVPKEMFDKCKKSKTTDYHEASERASSETSRSSGRNDTNYFLQNQKDTENTKQPMATQNGVDSLLDDRGHCSSVERQYLPNRQSTSSNRFCWTQNNNASSMDCSKSSRASASAEEPIVDTPNVSHRLELDQDSRSFSSLSESVSMDDENTGDGFVNNSTEQERFPPRGFSCYDPNLMTSTSLSLKTSSRVARFGFRTPSPSFSAEKLIGSPTMRDCKRQCLQDGLNLVIHNKESV